MKKQLIAIMQNGEWMAVESKSDIKFIEVTDKQYMSLMYEHPSREMMIELANSSGSESTVENIFKNNGHYESMDNPDGEYASLEQYPVTTRLEYLRNCTAEEREFEDTEDEYSELEDKREYDFLSELKNLNEEQSLRLKELGVALKLIK